MADRRRHDGVQLIEVREPQEREHRRRYRRRCGERNPPWDLPSATSPRRRASRELLERRLHDLGRLERTAHVDLDLRALGDSMVARRRARCRARARARSCRDVTMPALRRRCDSGRRRAAAGGSAVSRPRSRRADAAGAFSASSAALPRKSALSQPTTQREPGLQRRDPRAELVAVKRQARLQAQRVAGAESGGRRAGGEDRLEELPRHLGGHRALDAVLAGVTRPGDGARMAGEGKAGDGEVPDLRPRRDRPWRRSRVPRVLGWRSPPATPSCPPRRSRRVRGLCSRRSASRRRHRPRSTR